MLNGSNISANAAVIMMMPITVVDFCQPHFCQKEVVNSKGAHTIQLEYVMFGRLIPSAPGLLLQDTNFGSLSLEDVHGQDHRERDTGNDDSEGTERPSKVEIKVEQVGNPGAGEGAGDRRRAVDAEHDHTVLQSRHVREHDIDDVQHADMTSPIESMGGEVGLNVLADGFHDHADNDNEQHEQETSNSTPDIHDFGKREPRTATENR